MKDRALAYAGAFRWVEMKMKNCVRYFIFFTVGPVKIYLLFSLFYKEMRHTFFYFCRLTFLEQAINNLQ